MINFFKNIFRQKTYLDCELMKYSLHFFHDEIRTCCANAKGPVLYPNYNGENIDWDYVFEQRKKYIKEINSINGNSIPIECKGCYKTYTSMSNKKIETPENIVKKIYIQNNMSCNAKCCYCVFHNEEKSFKYHVLPLIKSLMDKKILSKNAYVFLSGGEITISPEFEELLDLLISYLDSNIEIATSGIKYSQTIEKAFCEKKLNMLLSLDCGTRETYQKIKGVDAFDIVVSNLQNYTQKTDFAKMNIILKYIIVDELNDNTEEISKFFDVVKMLGIQNVRLDIDTTKYNLNDFTVIPSHYKNLYEFFKNKANELNLTLLSDEQIECILKSN